MRCLITSQFDTAPKPKLLRILPFFKFDYQSVRHCSKTLTPCLPTRLWFDYQSVRHCSKTRWLRGTRVTGLITSQFDTAPKRAAGGAVGTERLITSQFDTAPKLTAFYKFLYSCLITSQFDTAPKRAGSARGRRGGLITSQFDTAPKRQAWYFLDRS